MIERSEGYVFACDHSEVPLRGKKRVRLDDVPVLIIACNSGLYAIEDRCPQTGRSLAHGEMLDCVLTSPNNGARYDLRTGRYVGGGQSPFQSHWLTMFPVKVDQGKIYVLLPVEDAGFEDDDAEDKLA